MNCWFWIVQVHYLGAVGDTVVAESTWCVLHSVTTNAVAQCMYFARHRSKIGIYEDYEWELVDNSFCIFCNMHMHNVHITDEFFCCNWKTNYKTRNSSTADMVCTRLAKAVMGSMCHECDWMESSLIAMAAYQNLQVLFATIPNDLNSLSLAVNSWCA